MAKKPAPLTSDLLVRKGEATPSSIDPSDRATDPAAQTDQPETEAGTPPAGPADAAAPSDDGRPQTPEPEIVLAADEENGTDQGSRRRLAGVLALVAVVTAGVLAVNMFGSDEGPSIAPVGEATDDVASADEPSVAPIMAPAGPESVGSPAAPDDAPAENTADLRLSPAETAPAEPAETSTAPEAETAASPEPAIAEPILEEAEVAAEPVPAPARETATVSAAKPAEDATAPPSEPASETPAGAIAEPGQHLVQLLSVRSEDAARDAWTRLQGRYGDLLGSETLNLEAADLGARGTFYRVRFGAFDSKAEANGVCQSLKTQGQDCLVKRAN